MGVRVGKYVHYTTTIPYYQHTVRELGCGEERDLPYECRSVAATSQVTYQTHTGLDPFSILPTLSKPELGYYGVWWMASYCQPWVSMTSVYVILLNGWAGKRIVGIGDVNLRVEGHKHLLLLQYSSWVFAISEAENSTQCQCQSLMQLTGWRL